MYNPRKSRVLGENTDSGAVQARCSRLSLGFSLTSDILARMILGALNHAQEPTGCQSGGSNTKAGPVHGVLWFLFYWVAPPRHLRRVLGVEARSELCSATYDCWSTIIAECEVDRLIAFCRLYSDFVSNFIKKCCKTNLSLHAMSFESTDFSRLRRRQRR